MRDGRVGFFERYGERRGLYDAREFARFRRRALEYAKAPRTREELLRLIREDPRARAGEWTQYVYFGLRANRDFVHAPPDGAWGRAPKALLVSADAWLGPHEVDADQARRHIVRRYLTAFGPASREDLAAWSGLRGSYFKQVLDDLGRAIVRFRDEAGRELLDLARAPRGRADAQAPARFLPKWDSLILAYAPRERARVLPERYRKAVIAVNGDTAATFLVDGVVAGTWTIARKGREALLRLEPFGRLSRSARGELVEEGERLVRFAQPGAAVSGVR